MDINSRASFLNAAGIVQGGIVVSALLLAAWVDLSPLRTIHLNWLDVAWGVLAILPMLVMFFLAPSLRRLVVELLGRPLSLCTWYDLILIAALAGFGEELLFRGVLQPWIGRLHPVAGVIGANVIFGLMHALTPGYAVVATIFGFYLSWLATGTGEPNLLRPIVAHAAYDYVAFLIVVREFRRGDPANPAIDLPPAATPPDNEPGGG